MKEKGDELAQAVPGIGEISAGGTHCLSGSRTSHRLVLGACWSRKFWELSAKWTKGSNVHQKRRKISVTKGKGSSAPRKKEDQQGRIEDQPRRRKLESGKVEST
jgi:hypothetical protein